MNKNKFWSMVIMPVLVFCTVIFFSSCDDEPEPELSVDQIEISFTAEGGGKSFNISANKEAGTWTITSDKNWIHTTPIQGTKKKDVTIVVDENSGIGKREGTLTIISKDAPRYITIKQEGATTIVTVSPADITFSGESGQKDEFTVNCNTNWEIKGVPEWLNVPSSGEGTTKCKIETVSANNSDTPRTANLSIEANGQTTTLKVTQRGLRSECYIMPANLVALYDEICFELQAKGDVNTFRYLIHSEYDINRLTDKEIEEELEDAENKKFFDDYIIFPDSYYSNGSYYYLQQNTTYYICTIAYDSDGKPGALKKTPIKTLKYIDYDNDAFVSFSDEGYNSSGFQFTCTKEGYCNSYHLIYGNLPADFKDYPRVLYAFEINYYLAKKKKHWFAEEWGLKIETDYPNNHTFTYVTSTLSQYPLLTAMAWGVFKDGSVSSDMTGFRYDISQYDVAPNRNLRAKKGTPSNKDRMIVRSKVKRLKMSTK